MTEKLSTTEYRKLERSKTGAVCRDYKREFLNRLHLAGLPQPSHGAGCVFPELRFAPPRRWRFDFCWADRNVACEYNGIFGGANASHASLKGLRRDYEKWTEAGLMGYRVILITAETVRDGRAVEWVRRALEARR